MARHSWPQLGVASQRRESGLFQRIPFQSLLPWNETLSRLESPHPYFQCLYCAAVLYSAIGATGYGFLCAPTTIPSPNYGYLVSADATQTHLFMDGTHLTQAGQIIVADYIYSLLVAPSQISFLAEAPVKTRAAVVNAIINQIPISQQDTRPGSYNAWITGDVSYLKMQNYSGFPDDPGTPVALIAGFDYKYTREWLIGAAFSGGSTKQTFSTTGNFSTDEFAVNIYGAYRNGAWWGDIIGSAGALHDTVKRSVPIGITIQPNNGNTNGTNYSLALEAGYDFMFAGLKHGPLAGIVLQRAQYRFVY